MTEWHRQREHRKRPQPPQMRALPVDGPAAGGSEAEKPEETALSSLAHRWHSTSRSRLEADEGEPAAEHGGDALAAFGPLPRRSRLKILPANALALVVLPPPPPRARRDDDMPYRLR